MPGDRLCGDKGKLQAVLVWLRVEVGEATAPPKPWRASGSHVGEVCAGAWGGVWTRLLRGHTPLHAMGEAGQDADTACGDA